jgi:hypothetical protein
MKFVSFVDKDKFELFCQAANIAGDVVVVKFGPEKITCNRICEDGGCLFSGEYIHTHTTVEQDQVISVALSTCELVTYLAQMPSGGLSLGIDNVGDFILLVGGFKISITPITPCPPSDNVSFEEYPLWLNIDTEHIDAALAYIGETSSIVVSREDDGLYFTDPEWALPVLVRDMVLSYEKNDTNKYSTMVDRLVFKKIFDVMSVYTSVKIILGEDMPLIIMGYDEQVKLSFMIAPQVEEEIETD